jgi:hypothetical protein
MTNAPDIRDQGLARIFSIAVQIRRSNITNAIFHANAGIVANGPFAGMTLLPEIAWGDGDLPPKLLGCYEAELHPAIAKAAARNPQVVINIGSAEGYYAVGIARLLPQARVYAFDNSPKAQDICKRAAIANQVGDRLVVSGKCEIDLLRPIIAKERPLLVVDCEGAEFELLDQMRLPELSNCDMVIECHEFIKPRITQTLKQRFTESHDIEDVVEGPRDPNQFAGLRNWGSIDRWLAVNEGRPITMNWLVCWARRSR